MDKIKQDLGQMYIKNMRQVLWCDFLLSGATTADVRAINKVVKYTYMEVCQQIENIIMKYFPDGKEYIKQCSAAAKEEFEKNNAA